MMSTCLSMQGVFYQTIALGNLIAERSNHYIQPDDAPSPAELSQRFIEDGTRWMADCPEEVQQWCTDRIEQGRSMRELIGCEAPSAMD